MRAIRITAAAYLLLMAGFVAGLYVARQRVWPFAHVQEITRFVRGHRDETSNLLQKVLNDTGVRPGRFLHRYRPADAAALSPMQGLPPLSPRRLAPLVAAAPDNPPGFIYI